MKGMNNKMKSCKKCCYITEIVNHTNPKQNYNICTLSRIVLLTDYAKNCDYYNLDLSNEKICMNCKHWIGGGDWGLSCSKDYYNTSSNGLGKACEKFERKDND